MIAGSADADVASHVKKRAGRESVLFIWLSALSIRCPKVLNRAAKGASPQ
jgi:hypothetical protein